MAYECIQELKNELNNIRQHDSISFKAIDELDEVYRKAKAFDEIMKGELGAYYDKAQAFDEIEQAYWKSNTPENFAYEFVGIFEEHFSSDKERADDER